MADESFLYQSTRVLVGTPIPTIKRSTNDSPASADYRRDRFQWEVTACKPEPQRPSYEVDGRYINAPDWPWATVGWVLAAFFVLLFVVASVRA